MLILSIQAALLKQRTFRIFGEIEKQAQLYARGNGLCRESKVDEASTLVGTGLIISMAVAHAVDRIT